MAICLERGADLHVAQRIPLPLTVSCFSKIQIGFTFLVLADPGSPGQRAVRWCKNSSGVRRSCANSVIHRYCTYMYTPMLLSSRGDSPRGSTEPGAESVVCLLWTVAEFGAAVRAASSATVVRLLSRRR